MKEINHIVLAGDSIFDNRPYVAPDKAVINHLGELADSEFETTLIAVDGDIIADMYEQLETLPDDASHLFISIGGNDALMAAHLLTEEVSTVHEAMTVFSSVVDRFQEQYRKMLQDFIAHVEKVTVCTIYDSVPGIDKESLVALKLFNEVILREAFSAGVPLIDLRLLCNEARDYSTVSPIEPSEHGGNKIANIIKKVSTTHDFSMPGTYIYC